MAAKTKAENVKKAVEAREKITGKVKELRNSLLEISARITQKRTSMPGAIIEGGDLVELTSDIAHLERQASALAASIKEAERIESAAAAAVYEARKLEAFEQANEVHARAKAKALEMLGELRKLQPLADEIDKLAAEGVRLASPYNTDRDRYWPIDSGYMQLTGYVRIVNKAIQKLTEAVGG